MEAPTTEVREETCCAPDCCSDENTTPRTAEELREAVRERYANIAINRGSDCCGEGTADATSARLGYSEDELTAVPEGANLGLGCGNPQAIANLKPGETVLDLGSGAGFDCFLAAKAVGKSGHVIGVDMTHEMLQKARENAEKIDARNAEFRLGQIEYLPLADNTVDVIISNCVVNLSPDKPQVYREAFRVLKPGGRLAISDVVAFRPLPENVLNDLKAYTGCMAGASVIGDLQTILEEAGYTDIRITPKDESKKVIDDWAPDTEISAYVASANVEAVKP
ncbi:MAG: arsenite methyltransferase [Candidatus Latescibacteria bacterium]|nr:arsenite methyltransferase [Candidatus Latescibacterota bacterium]